MLGDFFLVVTPIRLTSSGSFASATATRFWTSTWAVSRLVPSSKVTSRFICPSLVHFDDMYSIRSTPLTSCSMGVATVSATVRALAPGYVAVTWTVGGATSGYWAMGSLSRATPPTITMTTERTEAKIGRSMKKWESMASTRAGSWMSNQRPSGPGKGAGVPPRGLLHDRVYRVVDAGTL